MKVRIKIAVTSSQYFLLSIAVLNISFGLFFQGFVKKTGAVQVQLFDGEFIVVFQQRKKKLIQAEYLIGPMG
jgi:hypothetical protein